MRVKLEENCTPKCAAAPPRADFGPACDKVNASGADSVNIVFGCKADELF